ncbi:type IV pilin protein [Dyella japonica]|uniref:Type IV pilus assembly protein PilE n=1 Tax=Dyella japonica TaxID=231455 RepID=A0ABV2K427_9GAMM
MPMNSTPKTAAGFSLIELMITIAILAILCTWAMSSYTRYIQRSRRTDATAALSMTQGILERCYAQTFDYSQVTATGNGCGTLSMSDNLSPNKYYNVAITFSGTPGTPQHDYTLTATYAPNSPQANDTQCAEFIVSSATHQAFDEDGTDQTANCWSQ